MSGNRYGLQPRVFGTETVTGQFFLPCPALMPCPAQDTRPVSPVRLRNSMLRPVLQGRAGRPAEQTGRLILLCIAFDKSPSVLSDS